MCSLGRVDAVVSEEKVHYSKRSRDEDRRGKRKRIMEPSMKKKKKEKPQEAFITEKARKTLLKRVCKKKRHNKWRKQVIDYIALISKPDNVICIQRNK